MKNKFQILTLIALSLLPSIVSGDVSDREASKQRALFGYIKGESGGSDIPFWNNAIRLQILAAESSPTTVFAEELVRQRVVSSSLEAGNEFTVFKVSSPKNSLALHPETNFFVGFVAGIDDGKGLSPNYRDPFDYTYNKIIPKVYKRRIERIAPGCYGRWDINKKDEISAFLILVDTGYEFLHQKGCVDTLISYAFGIDIGSITVDVNGHQFVDDLTLQTKIHAAAFCRRKLNDRSPACAQKVLKKIYSAIGTSALQEDQ